METQDKQHSNGTILVVEDDELLLNLLRVVFERKGFSILTAKDGNEAVQTYTKYKEEVGLVLSDMGLPERDGRQTCKDIKQINPGAKVILASAYWNPKLRESLIADGAQDFIPKPYSPVEIVKKASAVLEA